MVRVGQDHGGVELDQLSGRDTFDGSLGADGAKDGRGNVAVRRVDDTNASPRRRVFEEEIEGDGPLAR